MFADVNATRIHYTIEGDGPWLCFSHSLACDSSMWDEQLAHYRDRYRVLRFDTRGHGASAAPPGAYSLDMLADDLHGLLQQLGIERLHFVGLSMGGMIGQTYELKYPGRFLSLTLADTSGRIPAEAQPLWEQRIQTARDKGMPALVDGTLARWFTEAYRNTQPAQMARIGTLIRNTPAAGFIGCAEAIRRLDLLERDRAIACPTLIVVGEQDAGTPVAMSQALQAAIPGAELVILPNASHLSNIEQPVAFNAALDAFLARHA